MVAHSGTPLRSDQLRPLNAPLPLRVVADEKGRPVAVIWQGRRLPVAAVKDCWRIEDEWWRRPIRRTYYLLEVAGGGLITVYRDHESGRWFRQWEAKRPPIPESFSNAGEGRYVR